MTSHQLGVKSLVNESLLFALAKAGHTFLQGNIFLEHHLIRNHHFTIVVHFQILKKIVRMECNF